MREIDDIYFKLCKKVIFGKRVGNTLESNNVMVTLHDIRENIVSIRDLSVNYLLGEWSWYFLGRNDVEFISVFGSMWRNLSDDGVTNNSAYGYLMKYRFAFDQIEKVVELLKRDPESRRAVINLNTPNERVIETKDEPCTIALQFLIRDEKLHCTAIMRSNDIYLGFPYDVAFFTELQKYIADRLMIDYGNYTHIAISLHLYDRDLWKIDDILDGPVSKEIIVDRNKFHESLYMIEAAIDGKIHGDESFTKEDLLHIFETLGVYVETKNGKPISVAEHAELWTEELEEQNEN